MIIIHLDSFGICYAGRFKPVLNFIFAFDTLFSDACILIRNLIHFSGINKKGTTRDYVRGWLEI